MYILFFLNVKIRRLTPQFNVKQEESYKRPFRRREQITIHVYSICLYAALLAFRRHQFKQKKWLKK